MPKPKPLPEFISPNKLARFWRRIDRSSPYGCWTWRGGKSSKGNPEVRLYGIARPVSRLTWKLSGRPLPAGPLQLNCPRGDRGCVNPDHWRVMVRRPRKSEAFVGPPKPNPLHQAILAHDDLSQEKLAAMVGTSQSVVSYVRKKYGVKVDHRPTRSGRYRSTTQGDAAPAPETGEPRPLAGA